MLDHALPRNGGIIAAVTVISNTPRYEVLHGASMRFVIASGLSRVSP